MIWLVTGADKDRGIVETRAFVASSEDEVRKLASQAGFLVSEARLLSIWSSDSAVPMKDAARRKPRRLMSHRVASLTRSVRLADWLSLTAVVISVLFGCESYLSKRAVIRQQAVDAKTAKDTADADRAHADARFAEDERKQDQRFAAGERKKDEQFARVEKEQDDLNRKRDAEQKQQRAEQTLSQERDICGRISVDAENTDSLHSKMLNAIKANQFTALSDAFYDKLHGVHREPDAVKMQTGQQIMDASVQDYNHAIAAVKADIRVGQSLLSADKQRVLIRCVAEMDTLDVGFGFDPLEYQNAVIRMLKEKRSAADLNAGKLGTFSNNKLEVQLQTIVDAFTDDLAERERAFKTLTATTQP